MWWKPSEVQAVLAKLPPDTNLKTVPVALVNEAVRLALPRARRRKLATREQVVKLAAHRVTGPVKAAKVKPPKVKPKAKRAAPLRVERASRVTTSRHALPLLPGVGLLERLVLALETIATGYLGAK